MIVQTLQENQTAFQELLSDDELEALFIKFAVQDKRKRKLFVRCFFSPKEAYYLYERIFTG